MSSQLDPVGGEAEPGPCGRPAQQPATLSSSAGGSVAGCLQADIAGSSFPQRERAAFRPVPAAWHHSNLPAIQWSQLSLQQGLHLSPWGVGWLIDTFLCKFFQCSLEFFLTAQSLATAIGNKFFILSFPCSNDYDFSLLVGRRLVENFKQSWLPIVAAVLEAGKPCSLKVKILYLGVIYCSSYKLLKLQHE